MSAADEPATPASGLAEELLDAAPDAILVVDATGLICLVNRQTEALFGYSRDDLIGQHLDMLVPERVRFVHAEHRASYVARPSQRAMGLGLEPAGRRKDGTEFPVGVSLSSLETDAGVLVLAAVRDITDSKRIGEERGQLAASVLKVERDEERASLEGQLQQAQRLESVGQLAGGVAHDFNNLLAGIMNYAGLVSESLRDEMDRRGLHDEAFTTLVEDVGQITHVARRAAALTRQLLIFSRRTVVQPEVLDLNVVVGDLEEMLRRTIGENVDHLQTVFADDLPLIKADRGQLDQVVMNLAVNARDAMPGGGQLDIETATLNVDERHGRLRGIEPGTYVRLTVSDTGTGMSREVVDRAFEPFFTTKAKGEGSGLGLATVYGIVRHAGGDVSIDSEPGSGTTIRVDLPSTSEPRSLHRAAQPEAGRPEKGETVLLVEDEAIVRDPAQRLLAKHGYTVLAAPSAAAAIAIAAEHPGPIHLLLTDVVMPGRSGKELSVDVAALRPDTKVLFMSGYSYDVIVHQGVLESGVSLIEKPFSADDLLRKVRLILDGGS
jgi:PAS domain S-box-containing protein